MLLKEMERPSMTTTNINILLDCELELGAETMTALAEYDEMKKIQKPTSVTLLSML